MKFALVLVIAVTPLAFVRSSSSPSDRLLLVPTAIDLDECVSKCKTCGPQNQGHEVVASETGPLTTTPHKCEELDPCDSKPVCDPQAPAPEAPPVASAADTEGPEGDAIRLAVLEHRFDDLLAFARAHPKRVFVNEHRSAVQLLDCTGAVDAHFPIPSTFAEGLIASLQ